MAVTDGQVLGSAQLSWSAAQICPSALCTPGWQRCQPVKASSCVKTQGGRDQREPRGGRQRRTGTWSGWRRGSRHVETLVTAARRLADKVSAWAVRTNLTILMERDKQVRRLPTDPTPVHPQPVPSRPRCLSPWPCLPSVGDLRPRLANTIVPRVPRVRRRTNLHLRRRCSSWKAWRGGAPLPSGADNEAQPTTVLGAAEWEAGLAGSHQRGGAHHVGGGQPSP